eukprot:9899295-Lingulodinium_polyedra.AAC.1
MGKWRKRTKRAGVQVRAKQQQQLTKPSEAKAEADKIPMRTEAELERPEAADQKDAPSAVKSLALGEDGVQANVADAAASSEWATSLGGCASPITPDWSGTE